MCQKDCKLKALKATKNRAIICVGSCTSTPGWGSLLNLEDYRLINSVLKKNLKFKSMNVSFHPWDLNPGHTIQK